MLGRHVTTAVTLVVLLAILVTGAVVGVQTLFAPLPESSDQAGPDSTCDTTTVAKGQRITTRQVQVSVFNAGNRGGLADRTMAGLVARGFRQGTVGNAPEDSKVSRVAVLTTLPDDAAARLVARQFGPRTKVRRVKADLGPGVDVIIGDRLGDLVRPTRATRALVARGTVSACSPAA
ncbi:MAG: LytR C-terminal domain-containing protein [Nocardioidaceae bacterium]